MAAKILAVIEELIEMVAGNLEDGDIFYLCNTQDAIQYVKTRAVGHDVYYRKSTVSDSVRQSSMSSQTPVFCLVDKKKKLKK